jgi:hypothetical protein
METNTVMIFMTGMKNTDVLLEPYNTSWMGKGLK